MCICLFVCVCIYIYIYIQLHLSLYTHTHTRTLLHLFSCIRIVLCMSDSHTRNTNCMKKAQQLCLLWVELCPSIKDILES